MLFYIFADFYLIPAAWTISIMSNGYLKRKGFLHRRRILIHHELVRMTFPCLFVKKNGKEKVYLIIFAFVLVWEQEYYVLCHVANAGSSTPRASNSHRSPVQQPSNYQTPASALYECNNDPVSSHASAGKSSIYGGFSIYPSFISQIIDCVHFLTTHL